MKVLVGLSTEKSSQDALALGVVLADTFAGGLTVANVYRAAFDYPSRAHVDAEWRSYLVEQGQAVLDQAAEELADRDNVEYLVRGNKAESTGLRELADEQNSDVIVLGSADDAAPNHLSLGSTSDQLLHSSSVPIALAPKDYRAWNVSSIGRVVVAFRRASGPEWALKATVRTLQQHGFDVAKSLELITLTEPLPRLFGRGLRREKHEELRRSLIIRAEEDLAYGKSLVQSLVGEAIEVSGTVLQADNESRAFSRFDWKDDDLLVLGSTETGKLQRVFLGDTAYKLIRAATVPVVVVAGSRN